MTRGKILLLIVVGFALVWVVLTVFAVRHVIAMSDMANREVEPHLPTVQRYVKEAPVPPAPFYPEEEIASALPRQWAITGAEPAYRKLVLAETADKGERDGPGRP